MRQRYTYRISPAMAPYILFLLDMPNMNIQHSYTRAPRKLVHTGLLSISLIAALLTISLEASTD